MSTYAQRWVVYSLLAGLLAAGLISSQDSLRLQEKRAEAKCTQDGRPAQPVPENVKDPFKVLLRGIIL